MIATKNHPSVVHFVPDSSLGKGAVVRCMAYGYLTGSMVANKTFPIKALFPSDLGFLPRRRRDLAHSF